MDCPQHHVGTRTGVHRLVGEDPLTNDTKSVIMETTHMVDITGVCIPESEWETTRIWVNCDSSWVEIDFDRTEIVSTWEEPKL